MKLIRLVRGEDPLVLNAQHRQLLSKVWGRGSEPLKGSLRGYHRVEGSGQNAVGRNDWESSSSRFLIVMHITHLKTPFSNSEAPVQSTHGYGVGLRVLFICVYIWVVVKIKVPFWVP